MRAFFFLPVFTSIFVIVHFTPIGSYYYHLFVTHYHDIYAYKHERISFLKFLILLIFLHVTSGFEFFLVLSGVHDARKQQPLTTKVTAMTAMMINTMGMDWRQAD